MIANTHEIVWKKMDELINEFLLLSNHSSDEQTILKSIKNINNKLSSTYPSQLRNRVNYQPLYGIEYIEKRLFPMNSNVSWVKELISFDWSEVKDNDNRIADVCLAYGKYIEIMCEKLISEYYNIRGNESGILRKINEGREEKITFNDYPYAFNI